MYAAEAVHLHSAGPGAATNNLDGDGVLLNRRQPAAFTAVCGTGVATWAYNICRFFEFFFFVRGASGLRGRGAAREFFTKLQPLFRTRL